MIQFQCECGKLLQVRDEHAGKRAACPSCGRQQVVPNQSVQSAVAPTSADAGPTRDVRADLPERERPVLRGEEARSLVPASGTSGKATASLILGLLSFVCVFFTGIPAVILGILGLRDIGRSQGRLSGKGFAVTGLVTGLVGSLIVSTVAGFVVILSITAVQKVREAASRVQSQNNLKLLALGMLRHETMTGRLPGAAIRDRNGKPLLSWRVAILPHIGEEALYRQFKLDEPWDSPNNRPLLEKMPKVYQDVGAPPTRAGLTYYQVIVGPGTAFERPEGHTLMEFPDGTSTTFLIVEANNAVEWTKPDDLVYNPNQPLPAFGTYQQGGGFNAVFADGASHFFPKTTPPTTLKACITRNGGEPVNLP
jgi:hypothetical protein